MWDSAKWNRQYGIRQSGIPHTGTNSGGAPLKFKKNMIIWCKIVIFHTKYPKNVRASLRWAQLF